VPEVQPAVAAVEPTPTQPEQTAAVAAAAPAIAAPEAPSASTFEWPPSTRLSYQLSGYYRGAVDGQAQVQWLRTGARYQVHLDVSVGPAFAPLMSRRMSSDGELTAAGLRPRRYDEQTRVAMRSPRLATVHFDDDKVRLPASEVALPPGVQDTASQFVQMTWLFTTRPELLQVGTTITIPLALPRRVDTWLYDVVARETLATPVGPVDTWHVKPRREVGTGGDLTAEMWVAPTLQYLPVRILIRQDKETYVDLLIERLPQQAADAAPATKR
jgi:Protein of unknown function (DUF3108)